MRKNYLILLAIICSLSLLYSQAWSQESYRKKINFDEGWTFHFGNANDPAKDFNYSIANIFSKTGKAGGTAIDPKFDDGDWRKLDLPHDWAVELPFKEVDNFDVMAHGYKPVGGLFPETSIGWYRKRFEVNPGDSGNRFVIRFDGIFRDANIWLNGHFVGNNQSGYIGVEYDITDFLNFGKENVMVIRVDATQYEGWFYEGAGIYRHVWLHQYNNLHVPLHGVFVHSKVEGGQAIVTIETDVEDQNLDKTTWSVEAKVLDREGKEVGNDSQESGGAVSVGNGTTIRKLTIDNPRLWSLEDPYLYRAVVVLTSKGKEVDRVQTRFGVKTIEITVDKGVFLNGQHVEIQGVNCHQDHAGVGSALPDYLQYYRIRLLKEMGVNSYRTSHNPPTPELLDACDSLGMLVLDETRLLNSSPEYIGQFERMVKRDRNHASIYLWSIGNEEGYVQKTSVGKRIALTMMTKLKELDPTRTCTYAADLPNFYAGINEVIPVRGFNYREFAIVDYHNDHPEQPTLGTEMGSTVTTRGIYQMDSVKGYLPDQDLTHPWWASLAETWWKIAADNEFFMGGYVWTGFDYRGEPTPFRWPNINSHFGIMDMCGFPKNLYYYYQSWWIDKDVLHISPHWNWKGKEGDTIDVWVNTNAENVELFLNNKSLGKKDMPRNGHLIWKVPYKPGTVKAVAMKNGRKIEAKVETTGEPVKIVLAPDRKVIAADGKDATVINVTAIDNKGREVPDAQSLIKFKIAGRAKIIGVGNGDPSCHEPDKYLDGNYQRSLFNGKCQLILQSGKAAGDVRVEASSEGLESGIANIQLK